MRRLLGPWICVLSIAGCSAGGDDSPPAIDRDASAGDSGTIERDSGTIGVDSGPRRDAGSTDGGTAGLQCEPCLTDADCAPAEFCTALPAGGMVCLRECVIDLPDCPERFDCVDSLLTDLPSPVCAPVGERCCVDADADDRGTGVGCRGSDCDDTNPAVYSGAPEACDGLDNDCDGMTDDGASGSGMVCTTGLTGACSSGVTSCEDGHIVCTPSSASTAETCDGIDQDCDGMVDEDDMGRALARPCYDGPAGTSGVGECTDGAQTCAGGEWRSCVGQVVPTGESCNGADDDCDGMTDDGNPGGGFACATAAPGVCANGTATCTGGTITCVGTIAPGSMAEICDTLDNDCDGMVNDGFPGLGTACTSGAGICRRGGVIGCNPSDPTAPPVCDAVPGTPSPMETCDYVDDDCDGVTDEGFRNATGVYNTVTNCGACGLDCNLGWPSGGPAMFHVVPTCNVSGSTATCGFVCQTGWVDADGVRDNGCELFPETDTIYVSTPLNGGADVSGCGTWSSPCGSIAGGLMRAIATAARRVRVSEGLFTENVTLTNGISLLGGHNHLNWVRNPSVYGTTIRGADTAVPAGSTADRIVVVAISITSATELSGFTINGINAQPGGNSIGIYVRDSDNDLSIRNNTIAPGAGGNGGTGMAGSPGGPGTYGGNGGAARRAACGGAATAGPAGGATSCSGTSVNGGAGGQGASPVTSAISPTRQPSGGNGATVRGGTGGPGGYNMDGQTVMGGTRQCLVYLTPTDGGPGTPGAPGADGAGGAGAASGTGTITTNQWRGIAGGVGVSGVPGGGGGGGAAPGGIDADASSYCLYPPTGGGGGAGGCGGTLGGGGSAGGASFDIFMVFTTTPTATAMPSITMNNLRRGGGGRGGDGGTGGGGGIGGGSGLGGPAPADTFDSYAFCLIAGAPGGIGGRGGHAGGGGGGAGGVSYDIWVSRPGTALPDYTMNTFEIAAGVGTAGGGGAGGNSSNTTIGLGSAGAAGAFGTVRIGT